jgi:hypothetical protein
VVLMVDSCSVMRPTSRGSSNCYPAIGPCILRRATVPMQFVHSVIPTTRDSDESRVRSDRDCERAERHPADRPRRRPPESGAQMSHRASLSVRHLGDVLVYRFAVTVLAAVVVVATLAAMTSGKVPPVLALATGLAIGGSSGLRRCRHCYRG